MDKFITELKNTADKVAKKSTELVEISKIKLNIANIKSEIAKNYKLLGEAVYVSQKSEDTPETENIEAIIKTLDELQDQLYALLESNAAFKNEKPCPACTKSNPANAQFCVACGHRFDTEDEA